MEERNTIYGITGTVCLKAIIVVMIGWSFASTSIRAQTFPASGSTSIRYVVNLSPVERIFDARESMDPDAQVRQLIQDLQRRGYHRARVDSIRTDESVERVYVTTGPIARIRTLSFTGVGPDVAGDLVNRMTLAPDSALDLARLERDAVDILDYFSERGYHMAAFSVASLETAEGDSMAYDVTLDVDQGPLIPLERLELSGSARTSAAFAARAAGLRLGDVLRQSNLEPFADRLREVDSFRRVGTPILEITRDSTAVMVIPVEEGPPGTFDLTLGYLPPLGPSGRAQVVGSGHLNLLNPFGWGRSFGLKLDRRPGQASSVDVHLRDPQFMGLPLQVDVSFSGLQQDSTYNRRKWAGEIGYRLLRGVEIGARYAVDVTRPGSAGLRLKGDRQRIPRSDGGFWGLVLRLRRLDSRINPRSGLFMQSVVENGSERERFKTVTVDGDTTHFSQSVRQERLQVVTRGYVPVFGNQALVMGADVQVLLSDSVDESDLFRFGGAATLRGYDEDQFRASTAVRLLLEYRVLFEAASHGFAFFDLGYLEVPAFDPEPSRKQWFPGFGIGMQIDTAVGVLSVSYALNDRDGFTNGRVHIGVSFGL